MKNIILILIMCIYFISGANAYDFDPGRNVTLQDLYSIKNGVDAHFVTYYGDGGQLTGITAAGGNASWNESYANTKYRADSWDNLTGVPHATPSNGDVTHFSLADEIYDWVISLNYKTLSEIVINIGNWSDDKVNYWDTSNDLDTVISNDEISEGKIAFSTVCAAGNHYYLSGNNLICEADDDTTYTAGTGLDLVDTVFSHTDTSTQTSSDNSGRTYIQDISLDTYGHITSITTATETVTNTDTQDLSYVAATDVISLVNGGSIDITEVNTDDQTCAEVSGCVQNAITDGNTNWDNSYGFVTTSDDTVSSSELDNLCSTNDRILKRVAGTWVCATDETGAGGTITGSGTSGTITKWTSGSAVGDSIITESGSNVEINGKILSTDWTNVTITESQVSDADWWDANGDIAADEISESKIAFSTVCAAGNHYYLNGNDLACEANTVDTSANTECAGGTTYMDGEGNCDDISNVYINEAGDSTGDLTSDLNIDSNTLVVDYDTNEVGIGIADPLAKFHVFSNGGNVIFQHEAEGGGDDLDIKFGYNEFGWYWRYLGSGSGDNNELQLWSEGQGGVDDQVYGIKQSGNIQFMQTFSLLTGTSVYDIDTVVANDDDALITSGGVYDGLATKQPLEATLTDIADGTINENLVNTAHPWADNEVSNTLTCSDLVSASAVVDISTETNLAVGTGITKTDDTLTVVGGTAITADTGGVSITAGAVGNTQLAYNTGQHLTTTSTPTFATLTTGQGQHELFAMNQDVESTDAVSFITVNTGQGANELYDMNQNVQSTDSPTFQVVTVEEVKFENDVTNHRMYDNTTCVFIKGDTSTLTIC